jgi:hypothetical protein
VDPTTAAAWLELLTKLGLGFTAGGALFVWALYTDKVCWCKDRDRERLEKEEWRRAALTGTGVAEKSADALERLVERIEARHL